MLSKISKTPTLAPLGSKNQLVDSIERFVFYSLKPYKTL